MKTYIGFDLHGMLPVPMELQSHPITPDKVRQLLEHEEVISRCFARDEAVLRAISVELQLNIPSRATEKIEYLRANDRYIEVKVEGVKISFTLWKVIGRAK